MKRLVDSIVAHPLLVLALFILAAALLGWQVRHFQIDASAETLLIRDNEHYIRTRIMSERFAPQEFLLIAYEPRDEPLFSRQTFTNLRSLTESLRGLERVESVRSMLNVPLLSLMGDGLDFEDVQSLTLEQQDVEAQRLKAIFSGHPLYEDLLVNEDQTATALQVLFRSDDALNEIESEITAIQRQTLEGELDDDERARLEALQARAEPLEQALTETRSQEIEAIRGMVADYEDDARIYLGGAHVLGYQLIEIIRNDLFLFGSIIAGVICVVLFALFGGIRWVLTPVVCCGLSVLMTMGLFGMLGLETTVVSSSFIALQLILTLAIVVHLIVQYREYSVAEPDWAQPRLIQQAFLRKVTPSFYAGLTTSVGFASLLFTGIQPVISFGWMMIIAMAVSICVSLILFPALMALFPRERDSSERRAAKAVLRGFDGLARRAPGTVLIASAGALLLTGAGLFLLDVENSFIDYFSESTDVHRELTFIDRELGGSTPLDLVMDVPDAPQEAGGPVLAAETVQRLQRVQAVMEEQEGMGKVLSIVNFTELAREINDGQPLTEYELTAIYRTLSEDLREDLVGSFFAPEHSQIRISGRVQDTTDGLNRAQLIEDLRNGVEALGIERDAYHLTNLFVLYQDILQRLFRSQVLALGIVYVALTLTFFAVFRSLRVALVAIAPNILSTVALLGIMGWLQVPLNLMTITIASIAMGIAVDDTIHYTHRYLEEVGQGSSSDAIQRSTFSVGHAILYTTLIVMVGFSQLGFSDFIPSVQFGLLASLAMALALLWNLTLLPVLLGKFVR